MVSDTRRCIARVVPDVTGLDKEFDYLIPEDLGAPVEAECGPGRLGFPCPIHHVLNVLRRGDRDFAHHLTRGWIDRSKGTHAGWPRAEESRCAAWGAKMPTAEVGEQGEEA